MDGLVDRWGRRSGVAWPVALAATITYGGLASPAFAWPTAPFSVAGTTGDATAALFNAGLVVAGVLALPYAASLWRRRSRAVGGLLALVGVSFSGAGLFPAGQLAHAVFGTGIMVGCWLLLWAAGVVAWRAGDARGAAVGLVLGTAALVIWLPYDLGLTWAQFGFAVAELVSFGSAGAWSVWTVWRRTNGGVRDVSSAERAGRSPDPESE